MAAVTNDTLAPTDSQLRRWHEWVHCVCVVTFDLELGQSIELLYPDDQTILSEKEKMNICYLAFPDSNSGCMGDTRFHVKIRSGFNESAAPTSPTSYSIRRALKQYNKMCPLSIQRADCGHLYGFVYFRQTKNAQLPRGYFQKSLVILTRLPFINLYCKILEVVAPIYFQQNSPAARQALLDRLLIDISKWPSIRDIHSWPFGAKRSADHMQLRIINKLFDVNLLSNSNGSVSSGAWTANRHSPDDPDSSPSTSMTDGIAGEVETELIGSLQESSEWFRSLEGIIKDVHLLWELVITNEPIIVIANSPLICSQVVQSLVSLISPLLYCGEVRPYFTIHDSEFKELIQMFDNPQSSGGGGSLPDLPAVGDNNSSINTGPDSQCSLPKLTGENGRRNCILGVTNPFFIKTLKSWPHIIRMDSGQAQVATANGAEFVQKSKVKTSHKRLLQNDKAFVKKIQNGVKLKRPYFVQTILLRRHMVELTESFLIPLERYLSSLMPLKKAINPFKLEPPQPKPFVIADFLQTVDQYGPQLTSTMKGDWAALYNKFFESANFKYWLDQRLLDLKKQLQLLQLEALATVDMKTWSLGKKEVELVDMILKIKQKLNFLRVEFLHENISDLSSSSGGNILDATQNLRLEDDGVDQQAPNMDSNRDDQNQMHFNLKGQLLNQLTTLKALLPEDLKNIL